MTRDGNCHMKIDIDHFTKNIHGRTVLNDVDLHFDSGDEGLVVGLQGINGSGKTMLIRALCGLIYSAQGTVTVDGQILGKDISTQRRRTDRVPGFFERVYGTTQSGTAQLHSWDGITKPH